MGLLAIDEKKLGREPQYYVSKWLYWQNYYLPQRRFHKSWDFGAGSPSSCNNFDGEPKPE